MQTLRVECAEPARVVKGRSILSSTPSAPPARVVNAGAAGSGKGAPHTVATMIFIAFEISPYVHALPSVRVFVAIGHGGKEASACGAGSSLPSRMLGQTCCVSARASSKRFKATRGGVVHVRRATHSRPSPSLLPSEFPSRSSWCLLIVLYFFFDHHRDWKKSEQCCVSVRLPFQRLKKVSS